MDKAGTVRNPILVAVALLALGVPLSGGCSNSNQGSFPYLGPSCDRVSNTFYSDGCWQCSQSSCSTGCETTDCAAYFQCFCACDPSAGHYVSDAGWDLGTACQMACGSKMTTACSDCRGALGQCEAQHCSAACGELDAG